MSEAEVITPEVAETNWQEQFNEVNTKLETAEKRYTDLRTYQDSTQPLRLPSDDGSDEDWTELRGKVSGIEKLNMMSRPDFTDEASTRQYYQDMGMPTEVTGYGEVDMHGVEVSADRQEAWRSAAHEAGMTDKQYAKVFGKILEGDAARNSAQLAEHTGNVKALNQEWGQAYEQKMNRIAQTLDTFDEKAGLREALKAGNVPVGVLRLLDSIAESIGTESSPLTAELNLVTSPDAGEMHAQIGEIRNKLMAMSPSDPQYQSLIDKQVRIQKAINNLG